MCLNPSNKHRAQLEQLKDFYESTENLRNTGVQTDPIGESRSCILEWHINVLRFLDLNPKVVEKIVKETVIERVEVKVPYEVRVEVPVVCAVK